MSYGCLSHSTYIVTDKSVICFGNNYYGQLGIGNQIGQYNLIEMLKQNSKNKIVLFSSGYRHFAYMLQDGSVFICGNNKKGELGLEENKTKPTLLMKDKSIFEIHCSNRFTFIKKMNGEIYCFGSNSYGQLGINKKEIKYLNKPTLILNSKINQISCGYYHVLMLKNNGDLIGFGKNKDGQLGTGDYENKHKPTFILNNSSIVQIICGGNHSLFRTSNGDLFSFGNNLEGQLGTNNKERNLNKPILILNNPSIVSIVSGGCHNLMLCKNGSLFVWGWNYHGQLGLGKEIKKQTTPKLLIKDSQIKSICCGCLHSMYLKSNNNLFVFGNNYFGEIGIGKKIEVQYKPKLLMNVIPYILMGRNRIIKWSIKTHKYIDPYMQKRIETVLLSIKARNLNRYINKYLKIKLLESAFN